MRAVNWEKERGEQSEEWFNTQTVQTFIMLEVSGIFYLRRERLFQLLAFWSFEPCPFYTLSKRERVAREYDMSAFLPTKMDRATTVYW